jgi:hypothetical protein
MVAVLMSISFQNSDEIKKGRHIRTAERIQGWIVLSDWVLTKVVAGRDCVVLGGDGTSKENRNTELKAVRTDTISRLGEIKKI